MMTPSKTGSATLADVARHAGVSLATASFVLSGRSGGRPTGSAKTQAAVRSAAEELGYVPNRTARTMRTGRTDAIVLAMGGVTDPWSVSVAHAVGLRAVQEGKTTLVLADTRWYEYLLGGQFDSCLLGGVDYVPDGLQRLRRLSQVGGGVVCFSEFLQPEEFDIISSNPVPAVKAAYRRLRSRHEKVHLLAPERASDPNHRGISRAHGFRDAAGEMGDEALVRGIRNEDSPRIYRECLEWLSSPERPRAVITHTGFLAVMLQAAAREVGLSMPEDLEIIGIGDISAESVHQGAVSYYGAPDVFSRLAEIVVHRSLVRLDEPGRFHRFAWEFFPGTTTREPVPEPCPPLTPR